MNSNLKLVSIFVGGLVTGGALTAFFLEGKIRTKYETQLASMKRVYQKINSNVPESDVDWEEIARQNKAADEFDPTVGVTKDPEYASEEPAVVNTYHQALEVQETPVEVFVDGGINDYGISYLEDEEYFEEDGRAKVRVDYLVQDAEPVFLIDGQQIHNWDELLGDSILVDFYKLVPPGIEQVLYVRNHKSETDYEVVQVME